jgi:hypothetical protein
MKEREPAQEEIIGTARQAVNDRSNIMQQLALTETNPLG